MLQLSVGERFSELQYSIRGVLMYGKNSPTLQLSEWGDPGADRYRKIVTKLKTQIENARGTKDKNLSDAIRDWEADLRWIQETFEKAYR